MIHFLDLKKINARFEDEFHERFKSFLNAGHYVLGEEVSTFETNFAAYCGVKYSVGVSNGLDALILIFKGYIALGLLKIGDEVIVPGNTFFASVLAIEAAGLKPILVDPDLKTYNISVEEIEKRVTTKTKAILIVHLYGLLADMEKVNAFAKRNNILVVEDAAQAHGAENKAGVKAGNLSDAGAFSFYPSKNLGALGDAGAVVSNNEDLIEIIKSLRNYGGTEKYRYELQGTNSRLDEIQAAFLNIKLNALDRDNDLRRNIAKQYLSRIVNHKITLPYYNNTKSHVFYAFVVLVKERDEFIDFMKTHYIETLIHYPIPPHKQKAFDYLFESNLPISEMIHNQIVSIPISPVMSHEEVEMVIDTINKY